MLVLRDGQWPRQRCCRRLPCLQSNTAMDLREFVAVSPRLDQREILVRQQRMQQLVSGCFRNCGVRNYTEHQGEYQTFVLSPCEHLVSAITVSLVIARQTSDTIQ